MAPALEPLARAGMACSLALIGGELAVSAASGACVRLLGYEPKALSGLALGRLLEGAWRVAKEEQGAGEVVALATAHPLLAFWVRTGERVDLTMFDASLFSQRHADPSSDFAGAAAHDLRNPLATVKLNLQVLSRQLAGADERADKRLSIALREVETLEYGLEALSECGRNAASVGVHADLPRALSAVAQRLQAELGAAPRVELEPGLPLAAVEESRLAVALAGLVRLAARDGQGEVLLRGRAGEDGGVRVEVRRAGFEPPARRSLAFALAQRVAQDGGGRFFVDRNQGAASLVMELAASKSSV